jgi:hypothetical protein
MNIRQEFVVKIENDTRALTEKFRAEAGQIEDQIAGLVKTEMDRSIERLQTAIVNAMNEAFSAAGSTSNARQAAQSAQRGAAGAG